MIPFLAADSTLDVAADPEPKDTTRFADLIVQLVLAGVGWTVVVEGTTDLATWSEIDTLTSTGTITSVSAPEVGLAWRAIRARVSVEGTGTAPTGTIWGRRLAA